MIIKTNGGLSVLSAFVDGIGSAVSIDMPMYTHINKSEYDMMDNEVIRNTVNIFRSRFNINHHYEIKIDSRIPEAMGLKSSSAMTLSIIYGLLKLNSINIDDNEILKISAEISMENKTSITGAMDDLSSCFYGVLAITDNSNFHLLHRNKLEKYNIIVAYSNAYKKTYDIRNINFRAYIKYQKRLELLLNGNNIFETMVLNGYLFASLFNYNMNIINFFLNSGAIFSGFSGKGPAIFAIFDSERDMLRSFNNFKFKDYNIIKSSINNDGINIIKS